MKIIKEALLERIRTGQFSSDAVFCTEKNALGAI